MIISLILAVDEQNGIGKNNQLLCHLPADLKYFKQTTIGHDIVMGRKTYESVGRLLPGRTNIIITRNPDFKIEGAVIANSVEEAIHYAKSHQENELFIKGGGEIFKLSMKYTDRIYLTRIHHTFDGDTFFPELDKEKWKQVKEEKHLADEKNKYDYSFLVYEKIK